MNRRDAYRLLLHARDLLWLRRDIPLEERVAGCDLIWSAVIRLDRRGFIGP